jgi:hypothetical protein
MTVGELIADLMKIAKTYGADVPIRDIHHLKEPGETHVFIRKWASYVDKKLKVHYITMEIEKQYGPAWTRTANRPDDVEILETVK